jgi:hypothetical protein
MSQRVQIYVLVGLLALAAALFLRSRSGSAISPGVVASGGKFAPLDVQEPDLRLDLLEQIHQSQYRGTHRDIFSGQPLPPPPPKTTPGGLVNTSNPNVPAGPPPVQLPAQFFGYANRAGSSNRVAFFLNGDNVLVVAEGDVFLGNFRLLHIGNDSAEVQEISSGRRAVVPLEQPPDEGLGP